MTSTQTTNLSLSQLVGGGYGRFWNFKGRYRVVKGGRASKKSKTCALWYIVNLYKYPLANLLVIRRYKEDLRNSCYADLQWAINQLGAAADFKLTLSPLEITRISTGQKIIFRGFDDAQKVKSITVPKGVLCWVWCEEASQLLNEGEFNTLDKSIRGRIPDGYFKQITLIFNPITDKHWLKKRFFDTPDSVDKLALTTNYMCNEWLDEADARLFEDMRINRPREYLIDGLGEWGRSEGLIFPNAQVREFDWHDALKLPGAKAFFGLDFGFTDPTAFVGGILCPQDKALFIFLEWYQAGVTNAEIAKALKQLGLTRERVICDAAEPKSIEELRRLGINAKPAAKGPDSVRYGIQVLQGYQIVIHPSCTNAVREFENYAWEKDRNGEYMDKPGHEFSHSIDACRYGVVSLTQKPPLKFTGIK